MYIFKNGTTSFAKPNGTGPFRFKSWTRGERSLFVRFDGYRKHNGPYVGELEFISINDPATRLNALSAGQVDAIVAVDPKLVSTIQANPNLRILQHNSGLWPSQFMEVDRTPFTDNRVRLALKYMVDRKAIIDTVLLGHGLLGNDIPCPFDPDYAHEIPQRPYDPEKARFLLKQAGHAALTVTLYTSDVYSGILDSSVVLAEQAKKVGVTINLNKVPADQYWSSTYLKVAFEITYWGQKPLSSQFAQGFESTATFNETHWNRPDFDRLVRQARRTLDATKRHELWVAAQRLVWQDSGYLIWGFYPLIDGYSAKVHGLVPSSARNLGWYSFTDVYLA
jgi:peptide/nickel transport system substrate-binding protein